MLRLHQEELVVSDDGFKELQRHGAVLVAADATRHQLGIQTTTRERGGGGDTRRLTDATLESTDRPHHVLQGARLHRLTGEVSAVRRRQGLAQHVQQPDGDLHLHERSRLPVPEKHKEMKPGKQQAEPTHVLVAMVTPGRLKSFSHSLMQFRKV